MSYGDMEQVPRSDNQKTMSRTQTMPLPRKVVNFSGKARPMPSPSKSNTDHGHRRGSSGSFSDTRSVVSSPKSDADGTSLGLRRNTVSFADLADLTAKDGHHVDGDIQFPMEQCLSHSCLLNSVEVGHQQQQQQEGGGLDPSIAFPVDSSGANAVISAHSRVHSSHSGHSPGHVRGGLSGIPVSPGDVRIGRNGSSTSSGERSRSWSGSGSLFSSGSSSSGSSRSLSDVSDDVPGCCSCFVTLWLRITGSGSGSGPSVGRAGGKGREGQDGDSYGHDYKEVDPVKLNGNGQYYGAFEHEHAPVPTDLPVDVAANVGAALAPALPPTDVAAGGLMYGGVGSNLPGQSHHPHHSHDHGQMDVGFHGRIRRKLEYDGVDAEGHEVQRGPGHVHSHVHYSHHSHDKYGYGHAYGHEHDGHTQALTGGSGGRRRSLPSIDEVDEGLESGGGDVAPATPKDDPVDRGPSPGPASGRPRLGEGTSAFSSVTGSTEAGRDPNLNHSLSDGLVVPVTPEGELVSPPHIQRAPGAKIGTKLQFGVD